MNLKSTFRLMLLAIILTQASACSKNKDDASSAAVDSSMAPIMRGDQSLLAGSNVPSDTKPQLIRSNYSVARAGDSESRGEVTTLCEDAISEARDSLDEIAEIDPANRTIDNTLLAIETTLADLSDAATPLTFMGYVSTDKDVNADGSSCEQELGQFYVEYGARIDIYNALVGLKGRNAAERRLLEETKKGFEQSGINLPKEIRDQLTILHSDLSKLEAKYSSNLNNNRTTVTFTADELKGVPANFLSNLKKEGEKFIVTTKSTDYVMVMENAENADTRKKMQFTYQQMGMSNGPGEDPNTVLLEKAIEKRAEIAKLMGFDTWADYRTSNKMVKNKDTVLTFLEKIQAKLELANQSDLNNLLEEKRKVEHGATDIYPWDIAYFSNQIMKEKYTLDTEVIRQYFPAQIVVKGMFQVYSKMLGVSFRKISSPEIKFKNPSLKVWAKDVNLYEIRNKFADDSKSEPIAYFYTDFNPRPGKYGHAAAFPLVSARVLPNGKYSLPISAIVANFTPPNEKGISYMDHDEVETIFHEFGHIMHQTLSRAPYASLSGSSVVQDFVEAPSQMLENWVWSKQILEKLSGKAENPDEHLPADLIQKMIEAKDFNQGLSFTKQLLYASFDMDIHSQAPGTAVDVTATYNRLYKKIIKKDPLEGGHFAASFGHLMGGYDAGYYGYLWSQVYADDMFTKFPKENLMDPVVGARYRHEILEYGNMRDASDLLQNFLQRAPSTRSFFDKLHIIADLF